MKHGRRACWGLDLAVAAAALALAGIVCALAAASADPLHVTAAQVAVGADGSFAPPARELDPAALPGVWTEQALPYIWPKVAGAPEAAHGAAPRAVWIQVPLDGLRPAADGLFLYLPRWQTIGRIAVYGDARLLYRSTGDIVWNGFNQPLWVPLDGGGAVPPPSVLRLRIDSAPAAGGAVSSLWIGTAAALRPAFELRRTLQVEATKIVGLAFLGLGAFALAVWLLRRDEPLYLLFALFTLLWVVRGMRFQVGLDPLPLPSAWFGWMTINSGNALVVTWYYFVASLVPRAPRWLGRLLLGWVLVSALATLPLLADTLRINGLVLQVSYFLTIATGIPTTLYMTWLAWRDGGREGIIVTAVWLLHAPIAIHDLMMHGNSLDPEGYYWWPLSTAARLLVFLYIILGRYVGAIAAVERSNIRLAERLQAREAELEASHRQLREVQERETLSRERQRLMQDIHDGMGSQLMSALKVAEAGQLDEARMAATLRECIDDLKLTVDSLEPVDADLLLLLATLRYRLTPRLQAAGISLRWDVAAVPPLDWLDPRSALHVLRILQEGIANVIQHAGATEIRVTTGMVDGGVVVALIDNGRGFGGRPAGEAGHGLANMKRRAQAIGADVSWTPVPGGTRLQLWLPLRQGIADAAD